MFSFLRIRQQMRKNFPFLSDIYIVYWRRLAVSKLK